MFKKLAVTAFCVALLGSRRHRAGCQNCVIANAQKALGDVKSINTYSGAAKDVAFQQCGANSTDMICRLQHDPMRPINNYVRRNRPHGPGIASNGRDQQHRRRRRAFHHRRARNFFATDLGPTG